MLAALATATSIRVREFVLTELKSALLHAW
jgi:hypothetical protein